MSVPLVGQAVTYFVLKTLWLIFTTITMSLRFFIRNKTKAIGLDDWLMLLGWILFLFVVTFSYIGLNHGLLEHSSRLTEYDIKEAKKWFLYTGVAYAAATAPIKASISVLLMRVTRGQHRFYKYVLISVIFISCVGSLTRIISYLTRCNPIAATWDPLLGHCSSEAILTHVSYFFGAVCIFTDSVCAIVPAFALWNVQLPIRVKVSVAMIMTLGFLASITTIIRMRYLTDYQDPHDYVYAIGPIAIWSEAECGISIIAGSLPTLRRLMHYVPCLGSTKSYNPTDPRRPAFRSGGQSYQLHDIGPDVKNETGQSRACRTHHGGNQLGNLALGDTHGATKGEESGAEGSDSGSQRHILTDAGLDIYKESRYEVRCEREDAAFAAPRQDV